MNSQRTLAVVAIGVLGLATGCSDGNGDGPGEGFEVVAATAGATCPDDECLVVQGDGSLVPVASIVDDPQVLAAVAGSWGYEPGLLPEIGENEYLVFMGQEFSQGCEGEITDLVVDGSGQLSVTFERAGDSEECLDVANRHSYVVRGEGATPSSIVKEPGSTMFLVLTE